MANTNQQILQFLVQVGGQDLVDKLSQAMKDAGAAGAAATPEIKALVDELNAIASQDKSIQSLISTKAQLAEVSTQIGIAKTNVDNLNASFGAAGPVTEKQTAALAKAESVVTALTQTQTALSVEVAKTSGSLEKSGIDVTNLAGAHAQLAQKATDTATKLETVVAANTQTAAATEKTSSALEEGAEKATIAGNAIEFVKDHLLEIASAAALAELAIKAIDFGADVFKEGLKSAADVQQSLTRVQAVAKGTADQFKELPEVVEKAATAVNVSTETAAAGIAALTSKGLDLGKAFDALVPTLQLAKIAQVDVGVAANTVATTLAAFNLPATEAQKVVDILATASHGAAGGLAAMSTAAATLAPDAQKLGLTLSGTVSILQLLQQKGLDSEKATRALRTVFQDLQDPTSKLRVNLLALGDGTNSFSRAAAALGGSSEGAKDALLQLSGESRAVFEALGTAGPAALAKLQDALTNSGGAAKTLADKLDDDVHGALTRFDNAFEKFAEDFARPVLKPLQSELELLAAKLTDVIDSDQFGKIQDQVAQFAQKAFAALNNFIAGIDWDKFADKAVSALQGAVDKAQQLADSANTIATAVNKIGDVIGVGYNAAAAAVNALKAPIEGTVAAVTKGAASMVSDFEAITGATNTTSTAIDKLGDELLDAVTGTARDVKQDIVDLKNDIVDLGNAARGAAPPVADVGKSTQDSGNLVSEAIDNFKGIVGYVEQLGEKAHDASQKLQEMPPALHLVRDAFGDAIPTQGAFSEAVQKSVNEFQLGKISLDQLTASMKESGVSADSVKSAFTTLGLQSQQVLVKAATDAGVAFATISANSKGTASDLVDVKNAFLDYAAKQIAATANLDQSTKDSTAYTLESKAAALGVSDALDQLISKGPKAGQALRAGAQDGAKGLNDAADAAGTLETRIRDTTGKVPSFTQEMASALESVRGDFVKTSDAAAKFFDSILEGDLENEGILKQTSQSAQTLGEHLAALREDAAEDVVGITKFYYALESAQAATNDKIAQQRAALKDLIAGYTNLGEQGGQALTALGGTGISSLKNLEQMDAALKAGTYDAGLLGQQELQPLQEAIEAAISKTQALADAAKQAQQQFIDLGSQLQDDLDTAAGNDEAVEDRRYEKQLADLKAAAQAAGQLNSQQYQTDVANAKALHSLKMQQIEQQAAAAKAAASGSSSTSAGTSSGSGSASGSQSGSAVTSSGSSSGSAAGPTSAAPGVTHVFNFSPTFYGGSSDQFQQFAYAVKAVIDKSSKLSK